jgi:signal peptidase I
MYYIASLLLLLFLLQRCLAIITVYGSSMEPTLGEGDRVLLLRCRSRRLLRYGQLVVCQYPQDVHADKLPKDKQSANNFVTKTPRRYLGMAAKQRTYFIKRIWGLDGSQIVIPVQEVPNRTWPDNIISPKQDDAGNFVWQIPPGHCFVKGDSPYSYDSTSLGPIPLDHIVGIVLLKLPRRAESIDPAGSSPPASIELPEKQ